MTTHTEATNKTQVVNKTHWIDVKVTGTAEQAAQVWEKLRGVASSHCKSSGKPDLVAVSLPSSSWRTQFTSDGVSEVPLSQSGVTPGPGES